MIYFGNPSSGTVREAMQRGEFGCIVTPGQGNRVPEGVTWCADNGRYGKGWPGLDPWLKWIENKAPAELCKFAAAPDVVGDAVATLRESLPVLPMVRELGLPAAFVAQDGCMTRDGLIPWDDFDVLFLGGSDKFKIGDEGREVAAAGVEHGKWVHMGRVSSIKRLRIAWRFGCSSVDGTYLKFGPDKNAERMHRFMQMVRAEFTSICDPHGLVYDSDLLEECRNLENFSRNFSEID